MKGFEKSTKSQKTIASLKIDKKTKEVKKTVKKVSKPVQNGNLFKHKIVFLLIML